MTTSQPRQPKGQPVGGQFAGKQQTGDEVGSLTAESTMTVDKYGTKEWRDPDGKLHRPDGPAGEWANGTKEWRLNGQRHRTDGPAIEWANGTKEWWVDGELHRTNGPAIEWADGHKQWWVNGRELTEDEFLGRSPSSWAELGLIDTNNVDPEFEFTARRGDLAKALFATTGWIDAEDFPEVTEYQDWEINTIASRLSDAYLSAVGPLATGHQRDIEVEFHATDDFDYVNVGTASREAKGLSLSYFVNLHNLAEVKEDGTQFKGAAGVIAAAEGIDDMYARACRQAEIADTAFLVHNG